MAEFAIASGIIQVAGAGVALTKALYNFGATTSSAGEQTDFIGKNITLYCRVLKTLGQQLKVRKPDHTTEALELARELQEQSKSLFQKIQKLLPTPEGDRSSLSLKQRIVWNFRRNRVDYLVGQLEYLKSTVNLLLNILSSVPKLRRYRRSKKTSRTETEDIKETLNEVQNLIYERCQAQRQLPILAEMADRGSVPMLPLATSSELTIISELESNLQLIQNTGPALRQIDAYAAGLTASNGRAMILQQTRSWVAQLYSQWTTLSEDTNGDGAPSFDANAVADLIAETESTAFPNPSTIETPRDSWVPESQETQDEHAGISIKSQPHRKRGENNCDCIRALLPAPAFLQELQEVNAKMDQWLYRRKRNEKQLGKIKEFREMSHKRNELEQLCQRQYLFPLYKKYRSELSNLLAVTDTEIADLSQQKLEAPEFERLDAITQVKLPTALERRQRLKYHLSSNEVASRRNLDDVVTMEPCQCDLDQGVSARTSLVSEDKEREKPGKAKGNRAEWGSASDPDSLRVLPKATPVNPLHRYTSPTNPDGEFEQELPRWEVSHKPKTKYQIVDPFEDDEYIWGAKDTGSNIKPERNSRRELPKQDPPHRSKTKYQIIEPFEDDD